MPPYILSNNFQNGRRLACQNIPEIANMGASPLTFIRDVPSFFSGASSVWRGRVQRGVASWSVDLFGTAVLFGQFLGTLSDAYSNRYIVTAVA